MEWYQIATILLLVLYGGTIAYLLYCKKHHEDLIFASHCIHDENIYELKKYIMELEKRIESLESTKTSKKKTLNENIDYDNILEE